MLPCFGVTPNNRIRSKYIDVRTAGHRDSAAVSSRTFCCALGPAIGDPSSVVFFRGVVLAGLVSRGIECN